VAAALRATSGGGLDGVVGGGITFTAEDALAHLLRIDYTAPTFTQDEADKGRVVKAGGFIPRGAFVAEYAGQLIPYKVAVQREAQYREGRFGSYMFFFEHAGVTHCIDATAERREYGVGRLINHSCKSPNLVVRKVVVDGVPRLALVALRDVTYGEELLYDYGERDANARKVFAWLRS
jgi:SET domain-containing protein